MYFCKNVIPTFVTSIIPKPFLNSHFCFLKLHSNCLLLTFYANLLQPRRFPCWIIPIYISAGMHASSLSFSSRPSAFLPFFFLPATLYAYIHIRTFIKPTNNICIISPNRIVRGAKKTRCAIRYIFCCLIRIPSERRGWMSVGVKCANDANDAENYNQQWECIARKNVVMSLAIRRMSGGVSSLFLQFCNYGSCQLVWTCYDKSK